MACYHERDYFFYRPGVELALGNMVICDHPVAIERQQLLVFGNGLVVFVLRTQHLAFDPMRKQVARRRCQGLFGQRFRADKISRWRVAHVIHDKRDERDRQPTLRLDRLRIELQRALEHPDCLRTGFTRWRLRTRRAPSEDIIQRIGILGCARGLRVDQLKVERDRNPARDFVLHGEQISRVAVEALGPEMRIVSASISWAVTRIRLPERRTLPSST